MTAKKAIQSKSRKRVTVNVDSWANLLNGLGVQGRDKTQATEYLSRAPLDYAQLTSLYRQDWIAKRVVDELVRDSFRAGFVFTVEDDDKLPAEMAKAWQKSGVMEAVAQIFRWALVYGGAVGVLLTDDRPLNTGGRSVLSEPLDAKSLKTVRRVLVVDRRYAIPDLSTIDDEPASPNFNLPTIYQVTPYGQMTTAQFNVHWTRILRVDGVPTDVQTRLANLLWGDSLLESMYDPLRFHGQVMQGAATTALEFTQGVLSMKDLSLNLVSDQNAKVLARVQAFRMGLGATGVALIDSEFEKYERMGQPITGLKDLIDAFQREAAGAINIPRSRLYGNQAGAVAGSESDHKVWAEFVHGWQVYAVIPALRRFTEVLIAAKEGPTKGQPLEGWNIKPNPIDPPDLDKEVTQRRTQAETDKIYFEMQALESTEIRQSRFGGADYSIETTLNKEISAALEEHTKQELENTQEELENPTSEPPPVAPGQAVPGQPVPVVAKNATTAPAAPVAKPKK